MKRILSLTFLLFGLLSCSESSEPADPQTNPINSQQIQRDIETVKSLVVQSFDDIWSDLDTQKIRAHHTQDFMLLENGVVWNNDSVASYLIRERESMKAQQYQRLNRFDFLKSEHHKHAIWVAYHNYGTWVKGQDTLGTAHWLESAIAIKDEGRWKLQQLHSTRVRK
jgi:hypothetical protein